MPDPIVEIYHGWLMTDVNERIVVGWLWLGCTRDADGDVIHVLGRPKSVAENAHETTD